MKLYKKCMTAFREEMFGQIMKDHPNFYSMSNDEQNENIQPYMVDLEKLNLIKTSVEANVGLIISSAMLLETDDIHGLFKDIMFEFLLTGEMDDTDEGRKALYDLIVRIRDIDKMLDAISDEIEG